MKKSVLFLDKGRWFKQLRSHRLLGVQRSRHQQREEKVEHGIEDLLKLEGMDEETARILAAKGVATQEQLADLDVDELVELSGMEGERANTLIMTARAPWFA